MKNELKNIEKKTIKNEKKKTKNQIFVFFSNKVKRKWMRRSMKDLWLGGLVKKTFENLKFFFQKLKIHLIGYLPKNNEEQWLQIRREIRRER